MPLMGLVILMLIVGCFVGAIALTVGAFAQLSMFKVSRAHLARPRVGCWNCKADLEALARSQMGGGWGFVLECGKCGEKGRVYGSATFCRQCGYDLINLPYPVGIARCPECGARQDDEPAPAERAVLPHGEVTPSGAA